MVALPRPGLNGPEATYAAQLAAGLNALYAAVEREVLAPQLGWKVDAPFDWDMLSRAFDALKLNYARRETAATRDARLAAQQAAGIVNAQNAAHLRSRLSRVLKVDPFATEPWLRPHLEGWVTENVGLVTSLKGNLLGELEAIVFRLTREEVTRRELQGELAARLGVSKNKAKLLARDQVSKLNAQLTKERQTRLGVQMYRWRNVQDTRVRGNPNGKYPNAIPTHWRMENVLCRWDDKTVYSRDGGKTWRPRPAWMPQAHPGEEINCRCWADPVLDEDDLAA